MIHQRLLFNLKKKTPKVAFRNLKLLIKLFKIFIEIIAVDRYTSNDQIKHDGIKQKKKNRT